MFVSGKVRRARCAELGVSRFSFTAECNGARIARFSLSTDDTRGGALLRGAFSRGFMRFLGVVESACFWSIRSADTTVSAREGGDLSRRWPASLAEEFTRVQRTTCWIFDVKVLLPRLVCSASKFQTSCLWNLTHACLAEATTRARFACGAPRYRIEAADVSIAKFNKHKSFLKRERERERERDVRCFR